MPPKHRNTKSAQYIEAWEGLSPDVGARTRRRTAKIESASSQSRSQSFEASGESSGKENQVQGVPHVVSARKGAPDVIKRESSEGTDCKGDLDIKRNFGKIPVTRQRQSIEHAVTTQNVFTPVHKSAGDTKFHIREDSGDVQVAPNDQGSLLNFGSTEHVPDVAKRELSERCVVLERGIPPEQSPTPPGKPSSCTNTKTLPSHDTSSDNDSDSDHDSNSEMTMTSSQEAIDQLKAMNEDLKAESKYHRLMAEITMKTAAVRRGYMRSPIIPSCLSSRLRGVYEVLLSDGLQMPNAASDRARTVADVIELHLTWEIENLKHCVNPSAAVNNFIEFVSLFVPQIMSLAYADFVGGEETDEVRETISAVVLRLMCWIVEQSVTLAETVAPQYLSYQAIRWTDEGARAMCDLDQCSEDAFRQRLQLFPEVKMPRSSAQVPGRYSPRIMEWAFTQLTSMNKLSGRLQRVVENVPNYSGMKVEPFLLTRYLLKDYLRHGQHEHKISQQFFEGNAATAMAPKKKKDRM